MNLIRRTKHEECEAHCNTLHRMVPRNSEMNHLYEGYTVQIGAMEDHSAFTVDFDGDDSSDYWGEAGLFIGETQYYPQDPTYHIWDITACRGDMNNDGVVDNFDIDPFVEALVYPADYADEFPGLEGSRVYHGDCDCSSSFNSFDIDPFVDLVEGNCCDSECSGCESFARGGRDASETAALLSGAVSEERFAALLTIVGSVASSEHENAEFWAEVLETLGG